MSFFFLNFLNVKMPHTPHTPGAATGTHPLTPGGPPSVSSIYNETNANQSSPSQNNHSPQHKSNMNNQQQQQHHHQQQQQHHQHNSLIDSLTMHSQNGGSLVNLTDVDLNADLNFDPAAVIDGENTNDLNVSFQHFLNVFLFHFFPFFHFYSIQIAFTGQCCRSDGITVIFGSAKFKYATIKWLQQQPQQ